MVKLSYQAEGEFFLPSMRWGCTVGVLLY